MTNGGVQITGDVAKGVVGSLGTQPILLTIVVLNVLAIGAAAYFLSNVAESVHEERLQLIDRCVSGRDKS